MRIRSIIVMDNGVKYCLPADLEEVTYNIENSSGMVPVDAICAQTEYQNFWSLEGIVNNQKYYTKESILVNPLHIISIIPDCIDLEGEPQ